VRLLILLVLLVGGFFFPFLWLGLAAYVFYLVRSAPKKAEKIIENAISRMLSSGRIETEIPSLYYEAARAYAERHGGQEYSDLRGVISFTEGVSGMEKVVTFHKRQDGGTSILLSEPFSF
jgi:predicted nucleic-acid-binding protein